MCFDTSLRKTLVTVATYYQCINQTILMFFSSLGSMFTCIPHALYTEVVGLSTDATVVSDVQTGMAVPGITHLYS